MSIATFNDRTYLKYNKQLFILESAWESFRPISGLIWKNKFLIQEPFKDDLFSEVYGYGSIEMKKLCRKLTNEVEIVENEMQIEDLWNWMGVHAIWQYDRYIFSEKLSKQEWKTFLEINNLKRRTLRNKKGLSHTKRRHTK